MKYKVGDRVRIKSFDWYNKNKDNNREIKFENGIFTTLKSTFLGQIMTIEEITLEKQYILVEDRYKTLWTDEMFEGLVEEKCPQDFIEKYCKSCGTQRCDRTKEYLNGCPYYNAYMCKTQNNAMEEKAKPKFKVGDRIITDTNMKGKIIGVVEEGWYSVEFESYNSIPQPNGVVPEENMSLMEEEIKSEDELLDNYEELTDRAFKGGYEKCKSDIELNGFQLPEGYQFVDENGNIINTQKIILEKKPDDKLKLESTKKVREYWSEYTRIFIEIYDDDPNECILTHLFTLEGHRQKGYAKKALAEAELIAKELGCHKAHLKVETNSWMYNWYLRCGYNWYKNANEGYTWLTKNL